MARCLLTVKEAFEIEGRDLLLVPGIVPQEIELFSAGDPILLKYPDGRTVNTVISELELIHPNPRNEVVVMMLKSLKKHDVPVGTEIWSIDRT